VAEKTDEVRFLGAYVYRMDERLSKVTVENRELMQKLEETFCDLADATYAPVAAPAAPAAAAPAAAAAAPAAAAAAPAATQAQQTQLQHFCPNPECGDPHPCCHCLGMTDHDALDAAYDYAYDLANEGKQLNTE
jgi:nucleoid-associated protein YgaU